MSLFAILTVLAVVVSFSSSVTIYNNIPRRDVNGNILHVGDGSLMYHDGVYYLYGTFYQPCNETANRNRCYFFCGWRNMTYAVYYSNNSMVDWHLGSNNVLPDMVTHPFVNHSTSAFFEPAVVYNRKTETFVMWFVLQNNLTPHKGIFRICGCLWCAGLV